MISGNWKEVLEPVDYTRSGALVLIFLATGLGSPETWIQADTIAFAVFGLSCILFPSVILSSMTDITLDEFHISSGRIVGIFLVSLAAYNFLNRKSRDPNVWMAVFLSRVVGLSVLLQTQLVSLMSSANEKGWTLQFVTFGMLGVCVLLLGSLVQAWKSHTSASMTMSSLRGPADHLSKHLFILFMMEVSTTFASYSYYAYMTAEVLAKPLKVDIVHDGLTKEIACLMLAGSIITLASLNFEDNKARKNLILLKFLTSAVTLTFHIYLALTTGIFKPGIIPRLCAYSAPYLLVSGLGYVHTAKHMLHDGRSCYSGSVPPCMALMLAILNRHEKH